MQVILWVEPIQRQEMRNVHGALEKVPWRFPLAKRPLDGFTGPG